jgi:TonB family protein
MTALRLRKIALIAACFWLSGEAFAQTSGPIAKQPLQFLDTEYPASSLFDGEEGDVDLNLHIDAGGHITAAEVIHPSGLPKLDDAAVGIAKTRWQFQPATSGGQSVASQIKVTAHWKLPLTPDYEYRLDPADLAAAGANRDLLRPAPLTPHTLQPSEFSQGSMASQINGGGVVRFKYQILGDGSVGDTQILVSSKIRALDDLAARIAKERWKFRPASLNGKPVKYWEYNTTPFRIIGGYVAFIDDKKPYMVSPDACSPEPFLGYGQYSVQFHLTETGTVDDVIVGTVRGHMRPSKPIQDKLTSQLRFSSVSEMTRPASCWINPDENFSNAADVALGARNYDRAIDNYTHALAVNPSDVFQYTNRGNIYLVKKDFDRARDDYKTAVALRPIDTFLLTGVCWHLAKAGLAQEAIGYCDKSLMLFPDGDMALEARAVAYLKLNDYAHAIADCDAALRIDPQRSYSLFARGVAKLKSGDKTGDADIGAARQVYSGVDYDMKDAGIAPP